MSRNALIADTNSFSRNIIQQMISSLGYWYTIHHVTDGSQALYRLQSLESVELVIASDAMVPMNGLQLLRMVREDIRFKALPFILILSEVDKQVIQTAKELSVSSILLRPFSKDTLRKHMTNILGDVMV